MLVSIPLEQGNVFRRKKKRQNIPTTKFQSLWNRAMSFDNAGITILDSAGFNPFGTGQCLSTNDEEVIKTELRFQSLWNRAMSFDK